MESSRHNDSCHIRSPYEKRKRSLFFLLLKIFIKSVYGSFFSVYYRSELLFFSVKIFEPALAFKISVGGTSSSRASNFNKSLLQNPD